LFEFAPISERVLRLVERRDYVNHGHMRINTERTKLYTDYYKAHEAQYPVLKRAGAMRYWCENCTAPVFDEDILVGSISPDFRSMNFYVEWDVSWLERTMNDSDEKFRAAWQSPGAVYMSDVEREHMREAAEYWKTRTISAYMQGIMPEEMWQTAENGGQGMQISSIGQGHYIGGYDKAVNVGFGAVLREVEAKLENMRGHVFGTDARTHAFYRGVAEVCRGAIALSKRYAASCREKAQLAETTRRAQLLKMADSLDWIMENPARTYWEGLEVLLLYQIMLCTDAQQHGESYGRVDKYVGHLLERELREGAITPDEAQELTDAFILRSADFLCVATCPPNDAIIALNNRSKSLYNVLGQYETQTSGIHLTVGGQNSDGTDSTNEVTRLVLKAYGRLGIPDPTAAIRIHPDTPEEIWQLAIESSKRAGGMPQFQNDEVIVPMLTARGLSLEDARNYSIVGCVEPSGSGCEWAACGNDGALSIWSLINCVVLAIHGGVNPITGVRGAPCKKLYEYDSFEEFRDTVEAQAKRSLDWYITNCNFYEQIYGEYFPCVAASAMLEGCVESGLDAMWGGCKYNSTGITCIGIGNVADSLISIKKLCFDEKRVPLRELYDALIADWDGYEDLRQVIINEVPHYGNANDDVDAQAAWGMGVFADHVRTCEGPRGKYCGGTFTMTAHLHMAGVTPATPDGRADGDPLADAISPRQGFDKNGPTAYLISASKLPHRSLWNGDQLNIRFSPRSVQGDGGTVKLKDMIRTYFDLSGMQVQFNVVGTEELLEAQRNPHEYQNLVVRIAGFSTYFVELGLELQNDFITRTEQSM
jgi:formate C-acetyltransferase